MLMRPEFHTDIAAIPAVTEAAFANHPHSNQTEHLLVEALRTAGGLLVSLVAEANGEITGHIAFSPIKINGEDRGWAGLGPVSVHPDWQRQGKGRALVEAGLQAIKKLNVRGCTVLGDPDYYGRSGFRPTRGLILAGVPPEYFPALPFDGQIPEGEVTYHPAFSVCA